MAVACDESKLAPLFNEYKKVSDSVRDLTDSWVGAIRKGIGHGNSGQKPSGERKPIKRERVRLGLLGAALGAATGGGLGGAGKDAQDHFGADATDADEMEHSMWRMQQLRKEILEEAVAARRKVCCCLLILYYNLLLCSGNSASLAVEG